MNNQLLYKYVEVRITVYIQASLEGARDLLIEGEEKGEKNGFREGVKMSRENVRYNW